MAKPTDPSKIRVAVGKRLRPLGFTQLLSRKQIPGSGGIEVVWELPMASGKVVVRDVTYRSMWTRLHIDAGVTVNYLTPFLQLIGSQMVPMAFGRTWYPYFQFGWSMGQATNEHAPYLLRGEIPLIQKAESREPGVFDRFMFEGTWKPMVFSDDLDTALAETSRALDCLESDALPLMARCATNGHLEKELFLNRWRISNDGPWCFARALGYALCGDRDQALSLLDYCQGISTSPSANERRNFETMRAAVLAGAAKGWGQV